MGTQCAGYQSKADALLANSLPISLHGAGHHPHARQVAPESRTYGSTCCPCTKVGGTWTAAHHYHFETISPYKQSISLYILYSEEMYNFGLICLGACTWDLLPTLLRDHS